MSPQKNPLFLFDNADSQRRRVAGFTLIELLVVIAVTAILATVAVPSFANLTAAQRAKTVSAELYGALLTTRSVAIQRNANVILSPNAGGWVNGWQILDPANPTNALDRRGPAIGVTIGGPNSITYRPSGRLLPGATTSFLVTAAVGSGQIQQCVSVDLGGRPYIVAGATC